MSDKVYSVGSDASNYMNINPYKFNEFSKICYHLAQQKNSRIASKFLQTTYSGRATTVQSIASVDDPSTPVGNQIQAREDFDGKTFAELDNTKAKFPSQTDTPNMDIAKQRRWIMSTLFEWGKLYDKPEEIQSIIDPHSVDMQALKYAFARKYDAVAYNGFSAKVKAGEYNMDAEDIILPNSQRNGVEVDSAGVVTAVTPNPFDYNSLVAIWETFGANEVDIDDPQNNLFMTVSQKELSALLKDEQYTSILYNNQKVLTSGRPNTFMGIEFVHYEKVKANFDVTPFNNLFCWAKSGMMFAEQNGARITRMAERADKRFNIQVYEGRSGGTVRLEEKKVLQYASTGVHPATVKTVKKTK